MPIFICPSTHAEHSQECWGHGFLMSITELHSVQQNFAANPNPELVALDDRAHRRFPDNRRGALPQAATTPEIADFSKP